MKAIKKFELKASLIILIFAFSFLFINSTVAHAEETQETEAEASTEINTSETDTELTEEVPAEEELTEEEIKAQKLEEWYDVCTEVGKILKKKGFRYSNGGTKKTLAKGIKKGRKCNCALYVSWCLQEYGAISKGKCFYVKGSGKLSKSLGKGVKVIRYYKKAKKINLKPGDVVCFTTPHACIYAGKNSKGKRVWFDQGKVATKGNRNGAKYKSYGKRTENYLNNRKVSYVIRIKDFN
ncbi:MAG: hypothetical protein IJH71_02875 [Eubacterium sp.]|nr:hypothetical protein [Eubacterium sp.]